jgi:hypothetical protein
MHATGHYPDWWREPALRSTGECLGLRRRLPSLKNSRDLGVSHRIVVRKLRMKCLMEGYQ